MIKALIRSIIVIMGIGMTMGMSLDGLPHEYIREPVLVVEYYGKNHTGDRVQEMVNYAYKISSGNIEFLATITHEGERDPDNQSRVKTKNGSQEKSFGLCQWNVRRWSHILEDPRFEDPLWQIDTCWEKYRNLADPGTIFHGYYARKKHYNEFIIKWK